MICTEGIYWHSMTWNDLLKNCSWWLNQGYNFLLNSSRRPGNTNSNHNHNKQTQQTLTINNPFFSKPATIRRTCKTSQPHPLKTPPQSPARVCVLCKFLAGQRSGIPTKTEKKISVEKFPIPPPKKKINMSLENHCLEYVGNMTFPFEMLPFFSGGRFSSWGGGGWGLVDYLLFNESNRSVI